MIYKRIISYTSNTLDTCIGETRNIFPLVYYIIVICKTMRRLKEREKHQWFRLPSIGLFNRLSLLKSERFDSILCGTPLIIFNLKCWPQCVNIRDYTLALALHLAEMNEKENNSFKFPDNQAPMDTMCVSVCVCVSVGFDYEMSIFCFFF